MSQEKVDKYKREKANRKNIVKKQKFQNALRKCAVGAVGLVMIGWIGYSAYNSYTSNRPVDEVQIDYTAVNELATDLDAAREADGAQTE
ncbi:hypothetical protein [uncultured Merdimonas sp.]|uniref:hypothetical protein n=1 Tax=uncultured Merdimonas sp. TaxID=2023269 RepID=UPI00320942BE